MMYDKEACTQSTNGFINGSYLSRNINVPRINQSYESVRSVKHMHGYYMYCIYVYMSDYYDKDNMNIACQY